MPFAPKHLHPKTLDFRLALFVPIQVEHRLDIRGLLTMNTIRDHIIGIPMRWILVKTMQKLVTDMVSRVEDAEVVLKELSEEDKWVVAILLHNVAVGIE
jgi:hypothetical protein